MKQAELQWEWKEVIRGLDALQQVEANFQGRRFLFRSHLTANASQAVRATIQISHPRSHRDLLMRSLLLPQAGGRRCDARS